MWWNATASRRACGLFKRDKNKTQLVIIVRAEIHRHLFEVKYVFIDLPQ
jgi:hypothetical protein